MAEQQQQYMLPLEAAQVEANIVGAVAFNQAQKRSETEKAQARDNIGASAFGSGIKIVSHFDTLAELEATITNPKAGDAYSVGRNIPYSLYAYDFLYSTWRNYGPIRSTDITARFAQNITINVNDWEEDTDVFVDYSYKAAIPLGEINGSDFPLVVFEPSDAISGNFAALCYAFDGRVEIWAKSVPASSLNIPTITFIVQSDGASGNSTKGITNASGGIATGGIGTEQIANGSLTTPKYANGSVTRAKLAQDALYSPVFVKSNSFSVQESEAGGTYFMNASSNDVVITLPDAVASALPVGADFAVFWFYATSITINFSDARVCVTGDTATHGGVGKTVNVAMSERNSMVAFRKMLSSNNGDIWVVVGDVEVVS